MPLTVISLSESLPKPSETINPLGAYLTPGFSCKPLYFNVTLA